MRPMQPLPEPDAITKLVGLLEIIYNSPKPSDRDLKMAYHEIGVCFDFLKNEINDLKTKLALLNKI